MRKSVPLVVTSVMFGLVLSLATRAQSPAADSPRYVKGDELARPGDYREWIFLSSGVDMNYNPPPGAAQSGRHTFTNVFVNPSAYRSFQQTGTWPQGTMLVLEPRAAENVSKYFPNNQLGHFQTESTGIEVHVKDSRFPSGWAFFGFRGDAASAAAISGEAMTRGQCETCHEKEGALDRTFVQFYPTLVEIARKKGTLRQGF